MSLNGKLKRLTLTTICAASVFVTTPLYCTPVYSVNTAYTPSSDIWSVPDVGWAFTIPLTAIITGVQTEFYQTDGRNVTVELYSGIPNTPGSVLVAQAVFSPVGGTLAGPSITPVLLTAGQTYFVGFKGVSGLGANYTATADPGVVDLPLYYDLTPPPYFAVLQVGYATGRPILLLDSEIPEPAALWLTGLGLGAIWLRRRRRT